jgi:hypothetical protein
LWLSPLLSEVKREDSRREPIPFQNTFVPAALFVNGPLPLSDSRAYSGFRRTTEHSGSKRQQKRRKEKAQCNAAMQLSARQKHPLADVCESEARYILQLSQLPV